MDTPITQIIIAVAGATLATLWSIQLWEIRNLRKDNKNLVAALAELTATIAAFRVELEHKVDTTICSEHRNGFERRKI